MTGRLLTHGRVAKAQVMVSAAILLGLAIQIGLVVDPVQALRGLPGGSALDYDGRPGGLARLSDGYLAATLGLAPPGSSGNQSTAADTARSRGSLASIDPAIGTVRRQGGTHPFTNDDVAGAFLIAHIPFSGRTDPSSATREPGESTACDDRAHTIWYRYVARESARLNANVVASRPNVSIGVFQDRPGSHALVACSNETRVGATRLLFDAEAGETYLFQVTVASGVTDVVFSLDPLGSTERVSISMAGGSPDNVSVISDISDDGRLVVFESWASDLVPDDTNGSPDVFVHDRVTGETRRVSVSSEGEQANGNSSNLAAAISGDGRFVAFHSRASNLVPGDTNGRSDAFVHDLRTGITERVSVSSDGRQGIDPGTADTYLVQEEGCTRLGDHPVVGELEDPVFSAKDSPVSCSPRYYIDLSYDGRHVVFDSHLIGLDPRDRPRLVQPSASAFDPGVQPNSDVFLRDRAMGTTTMVPVSMHGGVPDGASSSASISDDGRLVSFRSAAGNLVPGDTNRISDIFVWDRTTRRVERVSLRSDGGQINGPVDASDISGDGRWVVFDSDATNLDDDDENAFWDVYLHDRRTGVTELVSVSSVDEGTLFGAIFPRISADGRHITFSARQGDDLQQGDLSTSHIYVFDRELRTTTLVSQSTAGEVGDDSSFFPAVSASGRHITFVSEAANLVEGDGHFTPAGPLLLDRVRGPDIFVHTLPTVR